MLATLAFPLAMAKAQWSRSSWFRSTALSAFFVRTVWRRVLRVWGWSTTVTFVLAKTIYVVRARVVCRPTHGMRLHRALTLGISRPTLHSTQEGRAVLNEGCAIGLGEIGSSSSSSSSSRSSSSSSGPVDELHGVDNAEGAAADTAAKNASELAAAIAHERSTAATQQSHADAKLQAKESQVTTLKGKLGIHERYTKVPDVSFSGDRSKKRALPSWSTSVTNYVHASVEGRLESLGSQHAQWPGH